MFLFPSCFQHFLFVFNFGQFHEYVSWGVPPWVCFLLYSLCFLDLSEWFLSHVKEVFVMCSGPFSLSSASGTPIMQMLVHVMLFQSSHGLPPFLFNLFFLFCSSSVISTSLSSISLIHFSAFCILLLFPLM